MTTKSQQGNDGCIRKDSLARRFNLFRSTALFAARREIVKPNRACGAALGQPRIVKYRSLERAGSAKTRPNSFELCKRCSGENPAGLGGNAAPNPNPLGRETSAAFRATAREDLATGGRGHARAESVGTLTVQIARLKSSFHDRVPRIERVLGKTKGCRSVRKSRELYAGGVGPSILKAGSWRIRTTGSPGAKLWINGTRSD
jgi:hypothetical protein